MVERLRVDKAVKLGIYDFKLFFSAEPLFTFETAYQTSNLFFVSFAFFV
jgi:hypothetical protein